MELIVCLLATVAAVAVLHKPIARVPWLFYLIAAVVAFAYGAGLVAQVSYGLQMALVPLLRRCGIAFALLAVVMFVGVLPRESKAYAALAPIRGNLAIIAAILSSCHIVLYGQSYIAKIGLTGVGLNAATYAALAFAVLITVLFAVLTVTSVRKAREAMAPAVWKGVQRTAYAFFALIVVHALLMIGPSAMAGGSPLANAVVYAVVLVLYVVLRMARHFADGAKRERALSE